MSRSINITLFGIFFHVEAEPAARFTEFDHWKEKDGSHHFHGFGKYWLFCQDR